MSWTQRAARAGHDGRCILIRMRILAICGSLRAASSNRAILEACATLVPTGVDWKLCDLIGQLPHFNPDLDHEGLANPAVLAFRAAVRECDGLVFSTPEYVHSLPGSFKNALDWLVSESDFPGKPVAIMQVARDTAFARDALIEVLRTMSAEIVPGALSSLNLGTNQITAAEILDRDDLRTELARAIAAFVEHLKTGSWEE